MPKQGSKILGKSTKDELAAPCGVYCGACSHLSTGKCAGCIRENKMATESGIKQCRFYKCAIDEQGLSDCSACSKFPCRMLQRFCDIQPGREVRHYRHVTIDNLHRRKEIGVDAWLAEIEEKARSGKYHVGPFSADYWQQECSCVKNNHGTNGKSWNEQGTPRSDGDVSSN